MTHSKKTATDRLFFKTVFFCLFFFSLLMGIFLSVSVKINSVSANSGIAFIESWKVIDQEGRSFETGRTYNDKRAYNEDFTIISKLPDAVSGDDFLCFINRSSVKVFINDKLRYDFDRIRDTGLPGGSLKEFYVTVPLGTDDAGAELRIERSSTDWNPLVCPETFVTTEEGMHEYMLKKYGSSFALELMLFSAALIVTIISLVLRIWKRHTIDMLYGAMGILDVSCWLLSVSQLTPFLTRIYYVDGIMGFLFSMMMPFALLIYVNSIQKNRYRGCYIALFILSLVSFILWTTLHFSGIQSFQKSLVFIDAVLALSVLFVFVTLLIDIKKDIPKNTLMPL